MVSFSRLFDLASKAVDKASSSSSSSPAHRGSTPGGGRDWRDMVRSAADAVTGDGRREPGVPPVTAHDADRLAAPAAPPAAGRPTAGRYAPTTGGDSALSAEDRAAIARYDYLLRTADPDRVEQMHRDAFARLTPQQRAHVRERMDAELAPHERPRSDAPDDLARTAARAEAARPGRLSSLFARAGKTGLVGAGVAGAGGLLAAVAGGAVISAVAAPLLAEAGQLGVDFAGLAEGVDLDAMASGVDLGAAGEWAGGAQDAVSGLGDQLGGFGDRLSNLDLPGFGEFLGR
ncbi:cation-transporting ATPase [Microbacterium sp.]|uniref:cation-transporting ATPase n=1 Tax=Microbacterium sp. TaxID=51671 RepID=UPI003919F2B3